MKKSFLIKLIVISIVYIGVISFSYQSSVLGFTGSAQDGLQSAHGTGQPTNLFGTHGIFTTIANTLLYLVGALSVVMIIYGGLRYVVSGGNSSAVTAAKNTILYAIVGLVVSILSYAIINFILSTMMASDMGGGGGSGWSNM